jgi:hypothetical protein
MTDHSAQLLHAVNEMRDLLRVMAEPAIAERDKKFRAALREIAGSPTGKKAKAVLLMDGERNQKKIVAECGINKGHLSTLVKKLKVAGLLSGDGKQPRLSISIQQNFFDDGGTNE